MKLLVCINSIKNWQPRIKQYLAGTITQSEVEPKEEFNTFVQLVMGTNYFSSSVIQLQSQSQSEFV